MAVIFAGLPVTYESEGFDREHMSMPAQHNHLIEAVARVNPNVVVVLSNGSPIEMPWLPQVPAVLEAYLAGQAGGVAVAQLLFGEANPCGKLAETFPLAQTDVASDPWFPGSQRQVQYREGLYVGYRYFDSANLPVLFPFGHGLSYTTFKYGDLSVTRPNNTFRVHLSLTNVGERAGAEVVQIYVHDCDASMYRPCQELKAFHKVFLNPGEKQTLNFDLDQSAFSVYDVAAAAWVVEAGTFELRIGSSSRDIRLTAEVEVESEQALSAALTQVPGPGLGDAQVLVDDEQFTKMLGHQIPPAQTVRPFHINSTLSEIEDSWLGRRLKSRLEAEFRKNMGTGGAKDPTLEMMFNEMMATMPLRAFPLFSRGKLGIKPVRFFVALLNGQLLQAARIALGKDTQW